jgi:hypothetical protein
VHRILLNTSIVDAPSDVADRITDCWAGARCRRDTSPGLPDYRILRGAAEGLRVVVQDVHSGQAGVHIDITPTTSWPLKPLRPQADRDNFEQKAKPVS